MGRGMGVKTRDLVEGLGMGLGCLVPVLCLTTLGIALENIA